MKYAILSDMHFSPRVLDIALDSLEDIDPDIEAIILNGDLAPQGKTLQESQDMLAQTLARAAQSGKDVYFQPGSHEIVQVYHPVAKAFSDRYPNLHDAVGSTLVPQKDHTLIFLPGSDVSPYPASYVLVDEGQSGMYEARMQQQDASTVAFPRHHTNVHDLARLVDDPETTVLITHVPRRFHDVREGVDMAYFGERSDGSIMPGDRIEANLRAQAGDIMPIFLHKLALQNGYTLKRENRGNEMIGEAMDAIGLTKAISGHFHESAHRAHDSHARPLPEGVAHTDLYWNASYADKGLIGIMDAKDNSVTYYNVDLRE